MMNEPGRIAARHQPRVPLFSRLGAAWRHHLHRVLRRFPALYFRWLYRNQMRRLAQMLESGEHMFKVPHASRAEYERYDEREQRAHETAAWDCLVDGRIRRLPARTIRARYLDVLCAEIDAALAAGVEPTVLEVGCGNCINLVELKVRYGGRLRLSGFDVAANRIAVARRYYSARLEGVELWTASATDAPDRIASGRRYGIVFSMHCLEQMPYEAHHAVRSMLGLATGRVVFIEPVWEFAGPAQRLYLMIADHVRTLLPAVRALKAPILRAEPLPIQASLKNHSSLVVIDASRVRSDG